MANDPHNNASLTLSEDSATGDKLNNLSTDRAAHMTSATLSAGEVNQDSPSNSYIRMRLESNPTRANIGTTETLITAAPSHLLGVTPNDANTGYVDIRDASAVTGGSTPVFRINLGDGGAAGIAMLSAISARFENGITVQGENAACDVTVLWAAI